MRSKLVWRHLSKLGEDSEELPVFFLPLVLSIALGLTPWAALLTRKSDPIPLLTQHWMEGWGHGVSQGMSTLQREGHPDSSRQEVRRCLHCNGRVTAAWVRLPVLALLELAQRKLTVKRRSHEPQPGLATQVQRWETRRACTAHAAMSCPLF